MSQMVSDDIIFPDCLNAHELMKCCRMHGCLLIILKRLTVTNKWNLSWMNKYRCMKSKINK